MGFAIVGYFDSVSDERIRKLWQGMADIEVCNYLINSDNNPHIKFAILDELDKNYIAEKLGKAVDYLSNTELPFDGTLEKIGLIEFHPAKKLFSNNLE